MGSAETTDPQDPAGSGSADGGSTPGDTASGTPAPGRRLARNMALYTGLRIVLVVVLTLLIIGIGLLFGVRIPVFFAGLVALIIALPLSMVAFTRLRADINRDIAAVDSGRRRKRESLNQRLRDS